MKILCRDNQNQLFEVSNNFLDLKKFDVVFNQRVKTPQGLASVVGVDGNKVLWFRLDNQATVTSFPGIVDAASLRKTINPDVLGSQVGPVNKSQALSQAIDSLDEPTQLSPTIYVDQFPPASPLVQFKETEFSNKTQTTDAAFDFKLLNFLKKHKTTPNPYINKKLFEECYIVSEDVHEKTKQHRIPKINEELYNYGIEQIDIEQANDTKIEIKQIQYLVNLNPCSISVNQKMDEILKKNELELIKPTIKNKSAVKDLYIYNDCEKRMNKVLSSLIGNQTTNARNDNYILLALRDKKSQALVACIYCTDGGEIDSLVVANAHKKKGYGSILLACAIEILQSCKLFYLETSEEGAATYIKLGFVPDIARFKSRYDQIIAQADIAKADLDRFQPLYDQIIAKGDTKNVAAEILEAKKETAAEIEELAEIIKREICVAEELLVKAIKNKVTNGDIEGALSEIPSAFYLKLDLTDPKIKKIFDDRIESFKNKDSKRDYDADEDNNKRKRQCLDPTAVPATSLIAQMTFIRSKSNIQSPSPSDKIEPPEALSPLLSQ